jgi:hypothetical protein
MVAQDGDSQRMVFENARRAHMTIGVPQRRELAPRRSCTKGRHWWLAIRQWIWSGSAHEMLGLCCLPEAA